MRRASFFLLLAAAASCGSSLADPNQPTTPTATPLPAGTEADCMMFNPTACRLDVAKTSVAIDVHYPNVVHCRLQLLPTVDLLGQAALDDLAASWQVTMDGVSNQTVLTPEMQHAGVLEYALGTEQLYLTRVTFTSKTPDTLATLIGTALRRTDVSLFAAPIECPGRRPSP